LPSDFLAFRHVHRSPDNSPRLPEGPSTYSRCQALALQANSNFLWKMCGLPLTIVKKILSYVLANSAVAGIFTNSDEHRALKSSALLPASPSSPFYFLGVHAFSSPATVGLCVSPDNVSHFWDSPLRARVFELFPENSRVVYHIVASGREWNTTDKRDAIACLTTAASSPGDLASVNSGHNNFTSEEMFANRAFKFDAYVQGREKWPVPVLEGMFGVKDLKMGLEGERGYKIM